MNVKVVPFAQMSRRKKRLPSFGTVLLYEDLKFGQRAWDFYEKLTRRFAGDFEFSHLMWSFSILREPESLELAARSAADAHLLILACSGTTRLPSTMKDWLEQWARLATNTPAFVTLRIKRQTREPARLCIPIYRRFSRLTEFTYSHTAAPSHGCFTSSDQIRRNSRPKLQYREPPSRGKLRKSGGRRWSVRSRKQLEWRSMVEIVAPVPWRKRELSSGTRFSHSIHEERTGGIGKQNDRKPEFLKDVVVQGELNPRLRSSQTRLVIAKSI